MRGRLGAVVVGIAAALAGALLSLTSTAPTRAAGTVALSDTTSTLPEMCAGRTTDSLVVHAAGGGADVPGVPAFLLDVATDESGTATGTLSLDLPAGHVDVTDWCRVWQHEPTTPPGGECGAYPTGALTAHAVGFTELGGEELLIRADVRKLADGTARYRVRYRTWTGEETESSMEEGEDSCEGGSWTRLPAEGWYPLKEMTLFAYAPISMVLPAISGTPTRGQTLTASSGGWDNAPTSYAYQWQSCDSAGGNCTTIAGATTDRYTLTAADVGRTVRVVVSVSNDKGSNRAASVATGVILPPAPANTSRPTIDGTAQTGQLLVARNGAWAESPSSYTYQWRVCAADGTDCVDIPGANGPTFRLPDDMAGSVVVVVVTATNDGGTASAASEATAVIGTPQQPQQMPQPQSQAPALHRTRARLTLGLKQLPGDRSRLWGSVYPAHPGGQLLIQRRTGNRWPTVATVRLGEAAARRSPFALERARLEPGFYRAYLEADAEHLAGTSRAVRVRGHAGLTLRLEQLPGHGARLWGSVYPAHPGRQLTVQRWNSHRWHRVARVWLRQAAPQRSQYAIVLAHARPGLYRTYLGADATHLSSTSAVVRARVRVEVTLRLRWLTGERLRLWGSAHPARAGRHVTIQRRTHDGWRPVATVRLGKRAGYALTRARMAPGLYRVYLSADATHPASASPAVRARGRAQLTARVRCVAGECLSLSGSATPPRAGDELVLQRRVGGAWQAVAVAPLRQATRYRSRYAFNLAGLRPGLYRAHLDGTAAYRPSNSVSVRIG